MIGHKSKFTQAPSQNPFKEAEMALLYEITNPFIEKEIPKLVIAFKKNAFNVLITYLKNKHEDKWITFNNPFEKLDLTNPNYNLFTDLAFEIFYRLDTSTKERFLELCKLLTDIDDSRAIDVKKVGCDIGNICKAEQLTNAKELIGCITLICNHLDNYKQMIAHLNNQQAKPLLCVLFSLLITETKPSAEALAKHTEMKHWLEQKLSKHQSITALKKELDQYDSKIRKAVILANDYDVYKKEQEFANICAEDHGSYNTILAIMTKEKWQEVYNKQTNEINFLVKQRDSLMINFKNENEGKSPEEIMREMQKVAAEEQEASKKVNLQLQNNFHFLFLNNMQTFKEQIVKTPLLAYSNLVLKLAESSLYGKDKDKERCEFLKVKLNTSVLITKRFSIFQNFSQLKLPDLLGQQLPIEIQGIIAQKLVDIEQPSTTTQNLRLK